MGEERGHLGQIWVRRGTEIFFLEPEVPGMLRWRRYGGPEPKRSWSLLPWEMLQGGSRVCSLGQRY